MISLHYIRHLESVANQYPGTIAGRQEAIELSENAPAQAEKVRRYLAKMNLVPDYLFCSTAIRTQQTIRLLGIAAVGVRIDGRLTEMTQGNREGAPKTIYQDVDIQRQLRSLGKDFKWHGGESMNEVADRMRDWRVSQIEPLHRPDQLLTVLAVTHGMAITCDVAAIEQWDHPTTFAATRTVTNGSDTKLLFDGDNWKLDYFGRDTLLARD